MHHHQRGTHHHPPLFNAPSPYNQSNTHFYPPQPPGTNHSAVVEVQHTLEPISTGSKWTLGETPSPLRVALTNALLSRGQNPEEFGHTNKHMRHFIFNLSASLQDSLFAAGISPGSSWNDAWHAFNQLHCSQVGDFHQQLAKEASPRISDNTPAFSNVLAKRLNRWIIITMTSLGDVGIDQSWSALQRAVERAGHHFHHVALDAVAFLERVVPNSVTLFMTSQLALVRDASRHRALEPADVIDLVNLACKLESNLRQSAGSTRDGSFAGIS